MSSGSEEVRLLPLQEDDDDDDIPTICSKKRICFVLLVTFTIFAVGAVIVTVAIGWAQKIAAERPDPAFSLSTAVIADNIMVHLTELNTIAMDNGNGSRSVQSGYEASAKFIINKLSEGAGCTVSTQIFPTPIYTELEPPQLIMVEPYDLEFQRNVDFSGLRYGGNGYHFITNITCSIPNYGCDISDFSDVSTGCIALIQLTSEDDCPLITKAMNAQNASASAVILYNHIDATLLPTGRVRGPGWVEGDFLMEIPVLAGSYSLGTLLSKLPEPALLNLTTNTIIEITETFNVFCVTTEGEENSVIVVGAHLDSVPEGPGINDNGSGSATLLEIVLQWYALGMQPINKIRFAWWGSEEVGLIGSRYFVDNLGDDMNNIVMALNFDMLASPNYQLGIHDGSTAVDAQNGSYVITTMFEEYFNYMERDYNLIPLVAGSDFVPFVEAGIPSGGLAAGAGSKKNEDERSRFGGFANAPFDPCYHQSCDTDENIDIVALADMAGAAAFVIQKSAEHENLRDFLSTPIEVVTQRPTCSLGLAD